MEPNEITEECKGCFFFLNIALTNINQNNCKSSSPHVLERRACALSTYWLCLGRAAMPQAQATGTKIWATSRGRCWQAEHETSIAGTMVVVKPYLCTKSCYKRQGREALVLLSSGSDWVKTGLFNCQFLTEQRP